MATTKIEWADMTINPIVGCTKCSPGCDNCYAEKMAARLVRMPYVAPKYVGITHNGTWTGEVSFDFGVFKKLPGPGSRPRRIFVNSMGDSFHERVGLSDVMVLFKYMQIFNRHTFMILTKRADRMHHAINYEKSLQERDHEKTDENRVFPTWPLPNVWLGVTVCNAEEKHKVAALQDTPASLRFISFEPLLGDVGEIDLQGIGWVIVGGESGQNARPMHSDWVRAIREQCHASGVPFFFKQWGAWAFAPGESATHALGVDGTLYPCSPGDNLGGRWPCRVVGKKFSGCELDGREWKEVPA